METTVVYFVTFTDDIYENPFIIFNDEARREIVHEELSEKEADYTVPQHLSGYFESLLDASPVVYSYTVRVL